MSYGRIAPFNAAGMALGILLMISVILSGAGRQEAQAAEPPDQMVAALAAEAIGYALEGRSDPKGVQFGRGTAKPLPDGAVSSGNFSLAGTLSGHFKKQPGGGRFKVGGVVLHRDRFGRSIGTMFDADYAKLQNGTIRINRTTLNPSYPPNPSVAAYIVPEEKITPAILGTRPTVILQDYISKNAVQRFQTLKSDGIVKNYYVFVFSMDRLAEDASIGLSVSDTPSGLAGDSGRTMTFQDKGWHVALMPVKTSLSRTPPLIFKVLYTPGDPANQKQSQPKLVGSFTTDSMIQHTQRVLAAKGYRPGPIDGLMGRKTRSAIRAFQNDLGLKKDGRLSPALCCSLVFTPTRKPVKTQTVNRSYSPVKPASKGWIRYQKKVWQNQVRK